MDKRTPELKLVQLLNSEMKSLQEIHDNFIAGKTDLSLAGLETKLIGVALTEQAKKIMKEKTLSGLKEFGGLKKQVEPKKPEVLQPQEPQEQPQEQPEPLPKDKRCPRCKTEKPLARFYKERKTGKPHVYCIDCERELNRKNKTPEEREWILKHRNVLKKHVPALIENLKRKYPMLTDEDIKPVTNKIGNTMIYYRLRQTTVVEPQTVKPEIGIVDATQPDALPLVQGNEVHESVVDEPETKKKWNLFRKHRDA